MRQNVGLNTQHQEHANIAAFDRLVHRSFCSLSEDRRGTFAAFLGKGGEAAEAFRSFADFIEEGAERGSPEAFGNFEIGLHKQLMGLGRAVIGKHVEGRDENIGPVRRDGQIFYRSTEATSKIIHTLFGPVTFFRPPLAGKPVVLAGRRKPGPVRQVPHGSGSSQCPYAPVSRRRTGPKSSNGWEV